MFAASILLLAVSPGTSRALGDPAHSGRAVAVPLLQDGPPVERRLQRSVKDAYRDIRRSFKRSQYFILNSPSWWGRRIRRMMWPLIFALGALLMDTALLAEWKNNGLRVLTTYVPLMFYVYARLFFSRGVRLIPRLGVVVALMYGAWRHDLIRDGRWSALGRGRLDDLVVIVIAVRVFVYACPEALVEMYAQRAVRLRARISRARLSARSR